jgi:hypothetical protein
MARSNAVGSGTTRIYPGPPDMRIGEVPATVSCVDVRIGVTQAPREISLEVDDSSRDDLKARVEAALSGATDVLWITDKRGKDIGVPSAKIAYVEVGSAEGERRIGFGG